MYSVNGAKPIHVNFEHIVFLKQKNNGEMSIWTNICKRVRIILKFEVNFLNIYIYIVVSIDYAYFYHFIYTYLPLFSREECSLLCLITLS